MEVKGFINNQPQKYLATSVLIKNLRFADLLGYSDTISISYDMVEDPSLIFMVLNYVTDGLAF